MPASQELEQLYSRLSAGRFGPDDGITDHQVDVSAPPLGENATAELLLSRGCTLLSADAYVPALSLLRRGLDRLLEKPDARVLGLGCHAAIELWDDVALAEISSIWVDRAWQSHDRDARASSLLYHGGAYEITVGRLEAAAASLTVAAKLTGRGDANQLGAALGLLLVAAWRGHEQTVRAQVDDRIQEATSDGKGAALNAVHYLLAVLENGLGNYEAARRAAEQACDYGWFAVSSRALPELVEAATRSRAPEIAARAAGRLAERALASRTDWALGMHHRAQALIDGTDGAEQSFERSIGHLRRTGVVPQLARTELLYGEWLRRRRRRQEARHQLDSAHDIFTAIGAAAFADRTRNEILSTAQRTTHAGSPARGAKLTHREMQVARLVAEGHTNHEVGDRLFISPRTVEYHLRKIFRKLDVTTRVELATHVVLHDGLE